ncbi:bile acid:sodium symporter [Aliidiomarina minuta]|uniref:Bile acid:sodium symporter n=1 Tax=Aliidiomarina minuta TaxID=880057 RepID=A0A432W8Y7_9GAMM|nr:bile acid:sodium symporter family protein [Aliidiomarina minuta]RUO26584.1 bile acid:sodium symporter [Aliidiomarina minuta]
MTNSIFSQLVLPLSLFIIMFGMGLSLQRQDFARVVKFPKAVTIGLLGQMVLLPAMGFLIAALFVGTPALAVGLVLLAACPGGTTSNLISYHARGDLALSVTLTAITSVLTIITIPIVVGLALAVFKNTNVPIELPITRMVLTLFVITLLPISLGMLVRGLRTQLAQRLEPKISAFGAIFLGLLIIIILYEQGDSLLGQLVSAGPSTLLLNVVMMAIGFLLAVWFNLNDRQRASITVEVGVQNSTLAILIASTVLNDGTIALPAAMYSLAMYLTGGSFIIWRRWQGKRAVAL